MYVPYILFEDIAESILGGVVGWGWGGGGGGDLRSVYSHRNVWPPLAPPNILNLGPPPIFKTFLCICIYLFILVNLFPKCSIILENLGV